MSINCYMCIIFIHLFLHSFVYTMHLGHVCDHNWPNLRRYALASGDFGWEKVLIKYIYKLVGSLFISYSDKERWHFTIYMDFNLFHGRRMSNWYTTFNRFDSHIISFLVYTKLKNLTLQSFNNRQMTLKIMDEAYHLGSSLRWTTTIKCSAVLLRWLVGKDRMVTCILGCCEMPRVIRC